MNRQAVFASLWSVSDLLRGDFTAGPAPRQLKSAQAHAATNED